jgi:hypothetical protein
VTCPRNLPQHFNGCTCTTPASTATAEASDITLTLPQYSLVGATTADLTSRLKAEPGVEVVVTWTDEDFTDGGLDLDPSDVDWNAVENDSVNTGFSEIEEAGLVYDGDDIDADFPRIDTRPAHAITEALAARPDVHAIIVMRRGSALTSGIDPRETNWGAVEDAIIATGWEHIHRAARKQESA